MFKRSEEKEKVEETVSKMIKYLHSQTKEEHHIVIDSYFGGIPSLQRIVNEGFHAVMSCRKDRPGWIFEELHQTLNNLGDFSAASGSIETEEGERVAFSAISFKSSRNCNFLTTINGSHTLVEAEEEIDELNEKDDEERRRKKVTWMVPEARREYLENMNFVDLLDREVMLYMSSHRKARWEHTVFFWILKAMLVNTRLIHCQVFTSTPSSYYLVIL